MTAADTLLTDLRCLHECSNPLWVVEVAKAAADEIQRLRHAISETQSQLDGAKAVAEVVVRTAVGMGLYDGAASISGDKIIDLVKAMREKADYAEHLRRALERIAITNDEDCRHAHDWAEMTRIAREALAQSRLEIGLQTDQRTPGASSNPDNASHSLREREGAGNVSGSTNSVLAVVPGYADGMERAAQLCEEEAESARALLNENPHIGNMAKDRIAGIRDAMRTMANTIRAFRDDEVPVLSQVPKQEPTP